MHAVVCHYEIPARDMERASRFYHQVFGWRVEPLAWGGHPYYKVRGSAGEIVGAASREGIDGGLVPAGEGVEHPLLMIHVTGASLESCLEKIVAHGGAIDLPVTPVEDMGLYARFRDPEGNLMGLWQ